MSDPREVLERLDRNTACGYYEGKLSDDDVAALKSLLKAEDRVKTLEKYLPQILDECESTRVRLARSLEGEHIDSVTAERAYDDMDSAVFSLRALLNSDVTRPSLFKTAAKMPSSVLVTADAQGPASGYSNEYVEAMMRETEGGGPGSPTYRPAAPPEVQPACGQGYGWSPHCDDANGGPCGCGATHVPACGLCGKPAQGYAFDGDTRLCHPDEGQDCYTLWTLHGRRPEVQPAAEAPCGGSRCEFSTREGTWIHTSKSYGSCCVIRGELMPDTIPRFSVRQVEEAIEMATVMTAAGPGWIAPKTFRSALGLPSEGREDGT